MSIPKICPLLAVGNPVHMAKCREEGCAWAYDGKCAVTALAQGLDTLAEALPNEEAAQGAANAPDGKVEKVNPVSTSYDTKDLEEKQA